LGLRYLEIVNSMAIVGAFLAAAIQVRRQLSDARRRDADRRVERSLELHRDLVADGETAEAFHRLSVHLRRRGSELHGRVTWFLLSDADLGPGGLLDGSTEASGSAFRDLYQVLWFFERVKTALDHGLIDEEVLFGTMGFHCWWWAQLLRNVTGPKASRALHTLGPLAGSWANRRGEYREWYGRCMADFDALPPLPLHTESSAPPDRTSGSDAFRTSRAGGSGTG
jgi:hypothetical protein